MAACRRPGAEEEHASRARSQGAGKALRALRIGRTYDDRGEGWRGRRRPGRWRGWERRHGRERRRRRAVRWWRAAGMRGTDAGGEQQAGSDRSQHHIHNLRGGKARMCFGDGLRGLGEGSTIPPQLSPTPRVGRAVSGEDAVEHMCGSARHAYRAQQCAKARSTWQPAQRPEQQWPRGWCCDQARGRKRGCGPYGQWLAAVWGLGHGEREALG
eukprot:scaffold57584_cov75-Phaeocystis_antarctica.AAC.3